MDGPVAAGVDDSGAARKVLQAAFQAASALVVVRTFIPPTPLMFGDIASTVVDSTEYDADEYAKVEVLLNPWRQQYAQVPVEIVLSHDSAASVLVGLSHRASLVIAGSRGRGPVARALFGSTGLQLLHHAQCPVLIARPVKAGES